MPFSQNVLAQKLLTLLACMRVFSLRCRFDFVQDVWPRVHHLAVPYDSARYGVVERFVCAQT